MCEWEVRGGEGGSAPFCPLFSNPTKSHLPPPHPPGTVRMNSSMVHTGDRTLSKLSYLDFWYVSLSTSISACASLKYQLENNISPSAFNPYATVSASHSSYL